MSDFAQGAEPQESENAAIAREAVDVYLARQLSEWEGQLGAATEGTSEYDETEGYLRAEEGRRAAWRRTGQLDGALALAVDERARADLKMGAIDPPRREAIRRGLRELGWDPEVNSDASVR
ncbi:hypothetical protein [Streptomyces sp. NPDC058374]|uniref:hypothetical protein n=1 Tax=unclassified Streptomyces TaxID=2593676 RepID=UPI00365609A6